MPTSIRPSPAVRLRRQLLHDVTRRTRQQATKLRLCSGVRLSLLEIDDPSERLSKLYLRMSEVVQQLSSLPEGSSDFYGGESTSLILARYVSQRQRQRQRQHHSCRQVGEAVERPLQQGNPCMGCHHDSK